MDSEQMYAQKYISLKLFTCQVGNAALTGREKFSKNYGMNPFIVFIIFVLLHNYSLEVRRYWSGVRSAALRSYHPYIFPIIIIINNIIIVDHHYRLNLLSHVSSGNYMLLSYGMNHYPESAL